MIDVCIAGFQKSGTTSLLRYLGKHSKVITHPQIEMSYFYTEEEYSADYELVYEKYYSKTKNNEETLLAKNAHLATRFSGLERLYQYNKNCKVVMILREPVSRAYSAYLMERRGGAIDIEFDEMVDFAFKNKDHWFYRMILGFGIYSEHITKALTIFPKENVYFLLFEDLKNNKERELIKISKWLGLNYEPDEDGKKIYNESGKVRYKFLQSILNKLYSEDSAFKRLVKLVIPSSSIAKIGILIREFNKNKGKKSKPMSTETNNKLKSFYNRYEAELTSLTGLDFQTWRQ